jgi:hypothetical protein
MNSRDLALMRREFKLDSYALPIKEVYSVYLKKDNGEIITQGSKQFGLMDVETRELYLNNFKKALTGSIDSKIFELTFKNINEDVMHGLLQLALSNKTEMTEFANTVVNKIRENFNYDTDIVINFIKSEYYFGAKGKGNKDDYVQAIDFILCTVNKVEVPKKVLKFDYSEMDFKTNSVLDVTVNLNSPLDAFMYPSFDDEGYVDPDKIIYYSHKSKDMNRTFIDGVLDCNIKPTAEDERKTFKSILQEVTENSIRPEVLQNIYEDIADKLQDNQIMINMKGLELLLEDNFINTKPLKNAFMEFCGGDYNFKIKNILPDFGSKSINILNDSMEINIVPEHLQTIKQIKDEDGRTCLNIILNEDVLLDDMGVETES